MGQKKRGVDEFPLCVHLVSWEKENVSSEDLEAAWIACNKYMAEHADKLRTSSTSACGCTRSMSAATRCSPAPAPTACRPGCAAPSASPRAPARGSASARCCSPCGAATRTRRRHTRRCAGSPAASGSSPGGGGSTGERRGRTSGGAGHELGRRGEKTDGRENALVQSPIHMLTGGPKGITGTRNNTRPDG